MTSVEQGTSGKAIASLILGLASFCLCVFSFLPGLLLGMLALGDINKSEGRLAGRGMAIAGMVIGAVGSLFCVVALLAAFLIPPIAAARQAAEARNAEKQAMAEAEEAAKAEREAEADETSDEMSDEEVQRRLEVRNDFWNEAVQLQEQGDFDEALDRAKQVLVIEEELLDPYDPELAQTYALLATLYEEQDDLEAARDARADQLAILQEDDEVAEWRLTDAEIAVDYLDTLAKLGIKERNDLETAEELTVQGNDLLNAGRSAEAVLPFTQARELIGEVLGTDHVKYAEALHNLAVAYDAVDKDAEAEPLYVEALDLRREKLGRKHPDYGRTANNLGVLYNDLGQPQKAEPLCREALDIRGELSGEADLDYATNLHNLASINRALGNAEQAEELQIEARDLFQRLSGEDSPMYATSINNLAMLYDSQGDLKKAEPLYRQAMEIRGRVLGEDSYDYAISMNNLANLLRKAGRFDEAEPLFNDALVILEEKLGAENPTFATTLTNLGLAYLDQGELEKAEEAFRKSLDIRKNTVGEKHRDYSQSLRNLAILLRAKGDPQGAAPYAQRLVEIERELSEENDPALASALEIQGSVFYDLEDYQAAEQAYREVVSIYDTADGEEVTWITADARSALGSVLLQLGRLEEAESLLVPAYETLAAQLGKDDTLTLFALDRVVRLYEAMNEPDKVAEYRAKAPAPAEEPSDEEAN